MVDSIIHELGSSRTSDLLQYSDFIEVVRPKLQSLITAAGTAEASLPDACSLLVNLAEQYFKKRHSDERRGPLKRRAVHFLLRENLGNSYNEAAVDRQIEFLLGMNVLVELSTCRVAFLGIMRKIKQACGVTFG